MTKILVVLVALIAVVLVSAQNWRRSVLVALVIAVLEGALRKWGLPQASQFIYFLKDFILIGAYLQFFYLDTSLRPPLPYKNLILSIIGLSLVWGIVQAFNPSLGSPIIGIFGLKNYYLYIPLMWLVANLFETEADLYRFLRSYLLLLIPIGLLATVQFFSPPTSPLNVYAWDAADIAVAVGAGGAVRVTGTFSYLAGYAIYLGFCLCLLLPLLTKKQPLLWQWITLTELSLLVITAFMTASRGLIITCILMLVGFLGLQVTSGFSTLFHNLRKLFLPLAIASSIAFWRFYEAIDAFWLRVTSNQDVWHRIVSSFTEVFTNFQYKALDGYGIGATFQANPMLRSLLGLPAGESIPVYYESEMGRIALEIGPLGFFLWYGLKLLLLFLLGLTYTKLKRPLLRQLALSAFLLQAISFTNQFVYNHTANLFQWFLYGFIFLLPHLEHTARCQSYFKMTQFHVQSSHFFGSSNQ
ncbi:MAG: hypothetical protein AAFV85_20775 [Cyanobacteria bacterium J06634_6]